MTDIQSYLSSKTYPGRGLVFYKIHNEKLLAAYWIMGRSANSRNRVFEPINDGEFKGLGVRTVAADESKCADPHLIIYNASIEVKDKNVVIITNGDQTNTIYDAVVSSDCPRNAFQTALFTRTFEDDAPSFTPRISMMINSLTGQVALSVLKCTNPNTEGCQRSFFFYDDVVPCTGRLVSTYVDDGSPLPSFDTEPIVFSGEFVGLDDFSHAIWKNLNNDNKIGLVCWEFNLAEGTYETKIVNKYEKVGE